MKPKIRVKGNRSDWKTHVIGDIASYSKGKGYSKSDIIDYGTPLMLYGMMYTKYSSIINDLDTFANPKEGTIYSEGGEIIIPGSGETPEDIAIASHIIKKGIIIGGDLNILKFDQKDFDPTFIALAISNGKTHLELSRYAQGKTIVHLRNLDIAKGHITCPSIEEQKKIALYFNHLDQVIQATAKKIESLRQVKAASLQSMFPQEGETTPRLRFKGFQGDWETVKLGEIANLYQPQTISKEQLKDKGFPVYGANGIIGYFDNYNHETDQILITCRGCTCGTVNLSTGKCWITGNAMVVNLDISEDLVIKRFIYYYLSNMDMSKLITGSGQPQIVRGPLLNFNIQLPTLEEQMQISSFFQNLDTQIESMSSKLEKLKQIKAACLDNMFV